MTKQLESIEDACERSYKEGKRRVWLTLSALVKRELNPEGRSLMDLQEERVEAIAALRELCAKFGDNDWPDDLYLSDIIEKHLARRLMQGVRWMGTDNE